MHYMWKYKLYQHNSLKTTHGQSIEILYPGEYNRNAGPDFLRALIKIDGIEWAGDIEIHQEASHWYTHRHHVDKHYNSVILHVVEISDCDDVRAQDGHKLPQLELKVPKELRANHKTLCANIYTPRCHPILATLPSIKRCDWLTALLFERIKNRADVVLSRVKKYNGDWEQAYFTTLVRNFGFGINGEAFEQWADHIPLSTVGRHRDNILQIEALFFGQAGFLNIEKIKKEYWDEAIKDGYFAQLKNEYDYLAHKFSLQSMDTHLWQFMRTRPLNFPYIRLSQLVHLYYDNKCGFSNIIEPTTVDEFQNLFKTKVTTYWETHYSFGAKSEKNDKTLSKQNINLLIINTVVPTLYAYGMSRQEEKFCQRAKDLLTNLPPESNHIIRHWASVGISVQDASDSQALIQLRKEYCDKYQCLHCRFGYEYLKKKPQ